MRLLWLVCLLCGAPLAVSAAVFEDSRLGGSLKSFNLVAEQVPGAEGQGVLSSAALRLELGSRLLQDFDLEIALDQQLLWSEPQEFLDLPADSVNRRLDVERSWNSGGRSEARLELDRFNLGGEHAGLRWTLGRQAIGFGRISIYSPLDVIAPFPPDVIDADVRPGVDALRLVYYHGLAGQVGAVVVLGDRARHNSYLLTLGDNLGQVDLLLLAGSLRSREMVGFGLAGELGPLGLKTEISWYRGSEVQNPGGDLKGDFAIAAFETWYRFENDLVLIAEYLYNGVGSNRPEQYPLVAASAPLQEGLSYLLGRHYLLLGPSYELHPLVTLSGLLIHNLQDGSSLIRPQLAVSLADNLQLDLFCGIVQGEETRSDPLSGRPLVRSEFGSAGASGGLLLRWYF